jgi:hypothetical protein
MAANAKFSLLKSEYWVINLIISVTMIVWFVTGMMYTNTVEPEMALVIVAVTAVGALLIMALAVYAKAKKVKGGAEYMDERSNAYSLKATRNAFVVTLVVLSLYMILGQMKPDSLYRIQALQGVFGVSVAAYVVSYFYYRGAN